MKYSGELAKPITAKKLGLLATDDAIKAESRRIVEEQFRKLPALFAAHGVELHDWIGMVFQLAEEYVPGFREAAPAGRPTQWSDLKKAKLKVAVDDIRDTNPGMTVTDAIRRVQRLETWKEKTKDMKVAALSKHYYAADTRWVAVMRDANAYELIASKD